MSFRRVSSRNLLLLIVVTTIIYHLSWLLVEQNTFPPTTNLRTAINSIKLAPTLAQSVRLFLPQSPLDDELLQLQSPLIRLVEYLRFYMYQ